MIEERGGMRRARGELYELRGPAADPDLSNADLAPTPVEQRTWTTYHIASLWIGLAVCIPTYMLAAGLVDGGMNWWQAILTILLGNLIVLLPMVAHRPRRHPLRHSVPGAGARLVRHRGRARAGDAARRWSPAAGSASRPGSAARRSTPCCAPPGRPGSGCRAAPGSPSRCSGSGTCGSWCAAATRSSALEAWAAPFLIAAGLALLAWAAGRAGGLGPILDRPSQFQTTGEFLRFFVPSLTAMVGFWATLALNIPDLTRYAKDQRAQVLRPAPRPADDHDALLVHRRRRDLGLGAASSARRSGIPVRPALEARNPLVDPALALRAAHRHAHHQRRRQRGGAGQRLRQPLAGAASPSRSAA